MEKLLIEICNPKQWKTISTSKLLDEGYSVYGANGVIGYYNQYTHENPTLMITCRGATCGSLNISEPFSYINGNAMALDDLNSDVNMKYLYYYLMNRGLEDTISGSAQPQITRAGLSKVKINYPNINVQQRIVQVLEKTECLMSMRKEQIGLLDELVKSRFIEMFGDPNTNSKGWDKKEFSKVCVNKDSNRVPLKQSDRDKREGDYPYYGATGIIDYIDDYIFEGMHLLIAEDGKNLETKNKDIAFLADGKFWVNNHAHVVVENDESNLYYLKYVINNINLKPYITGIDQLKLNRSNLDKILINLPPMELQNQFADFVKQVDKLKFEMENSLKELEDNFNSLMQKAFKGELFD